MSLTRRRLRLPKHSSRGGLLGVTAAATSWNAPNFIRTKYVTNVIMSNGAAAAPGAIQIVYDAAAIPQLAANNVIMLTPNVNGALLVGGAAGAIDWACTSAGTVTAGGSTAPASCSRPAATWSPSTCRATASNAISLLAVDPPDSTRSPSTEGLLLLRPSRQPSRRPFCDQCHESRGTNVRLSADDLTIALASYQ